jgi:hypothetical protein
MAGPLPWVALALAIAALTAVALLAMGRVPICTCGTVKLWHGAVISSENSQHLTDWYTPTHVVHGVLFYALLHLAAGRIGIWPRYALSVLAESLWEIAENTDTVIERYRAVTIALDYYGDSVVNSMSDIAAMSVGFALAARLPAWASVVFVVAVEIVLAIVIRDNLSLNVLMLLWPIEGIRAWQAGMH